MNRIRSAVVAAFAAVTCLVLPGAIQPSNAAPIQMGSHALHANGQDVVLVRGGGKGKGMRGRKMGRGGFYAPGRYSNRGRHLGWQRGRHRGWYR